MISHVNSMAAACALALAAAAPAALAQQQEQERKPQSQQKAGGADLRDFDVVVLYRTGWSAEQMLDTDVRGPQGEEIGEVKDIIVGKDGRISKVIVEVGGFLEIGDQHIGVPWNHVTIGRDMQWVQVPLREVEDGTFSLFGRIPQGEEVRAAEASWRVNELIGDYVSLRDVPRYGIASDVIFDSSGEALAVVVDRARGMWGAPGAYAYPYAGYDPGRYAYALPFGSSDLSNRQRFDYAQLGEQSRQARAPEERKDRSSPGASGATGKAKR